MKADMEAPINRSHQAWLSLGSNLGDRFDNLMRGIAFLLANGLEPIKHSGIYETKPVGYTAQPDFLNMVIHAGTDLAPLALLETCQRAEQALARERSIRWGPRTLDVDILWYDALAMDSPRLTLPHPRMAERAFVLGPLEDMAPGILAQKGLTPTGGAGIHEGIALVVPATEVDLYVFRA